MNIWVLVLQINLLSTALKAPNLCNKLQTHIFQSNLILTRNNCIYNLLGLVSIDTSWITSLVELNNSIPNPNYEPTFLIFFFCILSLMILINFYIITKQLSSLPGTPTLVHMHQLYLYDQIQTFTNLIMSILFLLQNHTSIILYYYKIIIYLYLHNFVFIFQY